MGNNSVTVTARQRQGGSKERSNDASGDARPARNGHPMTQLEERSVIGVTKAEMLAVKLVEQNRPEALRAFDQIPMRAEDLLLQTKLMQPYLANTTVAFAGDHDSTCLLLGMLALQGYALPQRMVLLDFDERLLDRACNFANRYGFSDRLQICRYNVFDSLPSQLVGTHDWFYTNPPYGSYNNGASSRLFIARGCELVRGDKGNGVIILPDDGARPWSVQAMRATQQHLMSWSWKISKKLDQAHYYHLDDDPNLSSSTMLVERMVDETETTLRSQCIGQSVSFEEIPHFYGRSVPPPYPRYINADGTYDYSW